MPNWQALNLCPCCQYEVCHSHSYGIFTDSFKLVDEPQLKYCKISIIDGNSSLRQVEWAASARKQLFQSDYFLSVDEVNSVEVPGTPHQVCFAFIYTVYPLLTLDDEGDGLHETEKDGNADHCVCNWHAALPDTLKSMFSKFDETGIFVAICCHGFILTCVDMVQSGEL